MSATKPKGYIYENVNVLVAIVISLTVIVTACIALILNALVETWPTQTVLGIAALAALGSGLVAFIVLGLRMLYHRLHWQINEKVKIREDAMEKEKKQKEEEERKEREKKEEEDDEGDDEKKETNKTKKTYSNRRNILNAIRLDVRRMDKYYDSSLDNLKYSFILAIVFCIVGLILFIILALTGFNSENISIFVGIIGGVSELFAGTAFLMYRSAQKQLYVYYEELHDNEMLLAAVEIAKTLEKDESRDAAYNRIIDGAIKIMTDTPENLIAGNEQAEGTSTEGKDKEGDKTTTGDQNAAASGASGKEEQKRTVSPKKR